MSCEDCFEELDRYVDATLAGRGAQLAVPGMRAHLHGCPACREDFASLLELTGSLDGVAACTDVDDVRSPRGGSRGAA